MAGLDHTWTRQRMAAFPTAAAGDAALKIFCTPSLSDKRGRNYGALAERARFYLRSATRVTYETPVGVVQGYTLQLDKIPRGTILVVHGWSGEAAFMSVLAEPLRRAGFKVVLFDLPAHGLSPGRTTNLIECAKATVAVSQHVGPLSAVVAHSFGGMVAMLAAEGHAPLKAALECNQFVLVACPNRLSDLTAEFSRTRGLTPAGQRAFEQRLERIGHRPLQAFATADMIKRSAGKRVLLVHCRDDEAVPFQSAEEIAALSTCKLATFENFGHNAILFAPPVLRTIAKHLTDISPPPHVVRQVSRERTTDRVLQNATPAP
jgi:pimeloyl-ACP methyl ester carboxylesterase